MIDTDYFKLLKVHIWNAQHYQDYMNPVFFIYASVAPTMLTCFFYLVYRDVRITSRKNIIFWKGF